MELLECIVIQEIIEACSQHRVNHHAIEDNAKYNFSQVLKSLIAKYQNLDIYVIDDTSMEFRLLWNMNKIIQAARLYKFLHLTNLSIVDHYKDMPTFIQTRAKAILSMNLLDSQGNPLHPECPSVCCQNLW